MYVIFDLDGTLADVTHRLHYIRDGRSDWDGFFRACVDDTPINEIIGIYKSLKNVPANRIEIWSGRSDLVREESAHWLTRHMGFDPIRDILRMRPHKDYTPDDELKESWLLSLPHKPDLVFDDRQKVVQMWRRNGIRCCQVAPGQF